MTIHLCSGHDKWCTVCHPEREPGHMIAYIAKLEAENKKFREERNLESRCVHAEEAAEMWEAAWNSAKSKKLEYYMRVKELEEKAGL